MSNKSSTVPSFKRRPASRYYFSQRLRLHYLDWGNPKAPDLLLLHGVQDHCRTWDWLVEQFIDDYHIIAPDLRGHGDSEHVRGATYPWLDYVYDVHQLVEQQRLGGARGFLNIIAHSMGGTLAALYAGAYPERVAKLVIIEGVGLWPGHYEGVSAPERVRDWVTGLATMARRSGRRYGSLDEAYERMQKANPHLTAAQAKHLTRYGSHQNEDGSFSWKFDNYTHAHGAYGVPEDQTVALWQNIICPVLLLNADDGFDHRIGQDGTLTHFQQGQLTTIANAGHWAHHDQLEDVVAATQAFLQR